MDKSTKNLIIILSIIAFLGSALFSGVAGFVIGRRVQRKRDDAQMEMAKENFKRLKNFKQGSIKNRPFGGIPEGAKERMHDLRSKSLVGVVLEIEEVEDEILWVVLSPINIEEVVWKVKIDNETKVLKQGSNVDKEEIKEGSHIMVLGEKDFEESIIEAEVINLKIK